LPNWQFVVECLPQEKFYFERDFAFENNVFHFGLWGTLKQRMDPSKNWCMLLMLLCVASTRYSLVKGERIVRFVLTTQLHALQMLARVLFLRASGGDDCWLSSTGLNSW